MTTSISIRQAILRAADSIEQNPHLFDFDSNNRPDCGTPGCLLGWIGIHAGFGGSYTGYYAYATARHLGYDGIFDFFNAIKQSIHRAKPDRYVNWQGDANEAAFALRAYVNDNHPAENKPSNLRTGIPDMVTEIFERVAA